MLGQENGSKTLLGFEETEKMSDEELDAYVATLTTEEAFAWILQGMQETLSLIASDVKEFTSS